MKLNLDRLSSKPKRHDFDPDPAWWLEHIAPAEGDPEEVAEYEADPDDEEPVGPIHIDLDAHKMGEDVYLDGALESSLAVECSRCASRYRHALRESFTLVLESARDRVPADPESAAALKRDGLCLGDELETGWFRGSELDLAALFSEVMVCGVPAQPLCRENCRGLCPHCGGDRNETDCSCAEEPKPYSPFAALAVLKNGVQGE